jgi:hypothetical protein
MMKPNIDHIGWMNLPKFNYVLHFLHNKKTSCQAGVEGPIWTHAAWQQHGVLGGWVTTSAKLHVVE